MRMCSSDGLASVIMRTTGRGGRGAPPLPFGWALASSLTRSDAFLLTFDSLPPP